MDAPVQVSMLGEGISDAFNPGNDSQGSAGSLYYDAFSDSHDTRWRGSYAYGKRTVHQLTTCEKSHQRYVPCSDKRLVSSNAGYS